MLPTRNRHRDLVGAVEACRAQTLEDWELVIVDDGSDDGRTPEQIATLVRRDARVRSVRHERQRRLPAALNTGFRESRGELLSWVSDDDRYRPEALEHLSRHLRDHPEADLVYSRYSVVDASGALLREGFTAPAAGLLDLGNCIGSCFMYRRAVQAELGGYREELFLAEDYDFWLRAYTRFRFERLDRDLFVRRDHPGTLTSRYRSEIARAGTSALEDYRSQHVPAGRQLAGLLGLIAFYADRAGDRATARSRLLAATRLDPRLVLRTRLPLALRLAFGDRIGPRLLRLARALGAAGATPA